MTTITVSRQFGSGGRKIAAQICETLGYRFFDKRLIEQVATEVGLTGQEFVDFSEQHFKEKTFMERLMQTIFGARSQAIPASRQTWGGLEAHLDEDWYVELINRAILSAHEEGKVIIVGRGGQAVLRDKPGVLHVRVQAPMITRIQRLQQFEGISSDLAAKLALDHDKASARYLERFFRIQWDDPMLYHLVINTGKWTTDTAAQVIANTAKQMEAVPAA
jgi:CMP/dCMP kinase